MYIQFTSCVCGVVDLKKAVDTDDNKILIGKLEHYGKRYGKRLVCFYLVKRKQFVSINNHKSTIQTILAGVPQDSENA